jgi:hypothetical protein
MEYLQYQLHVSASILAIIELITLFKVLIFMLPPIVKQDLIPPPPSIPYRLYSLLIKLIGNLMMANVDVETCR